MHEQIDPGGLGAVSKEAGEFVLLQGKIRVTPKFAVIIRQRQCQISQSMGIQGLLRFIKDATSEIHIKEYAGRCVAVDTYCWLHRGSFACADKLAKGEKTDQ